jgi:hypothetical protein
MDGYVAGEVNLNLASLIAISESTKILDFPSKI